MSKKKMLPFSPELSEFLEEKRKKRNRIPDNLCSKLFFLCACTRTIEKSSHQDILQQAKEKEDDLQQPSCISLPFLPPAEVTDPTADRMLR
jgi:hypothetical protein